MSIVPVRDIATTGVVTDRPSFDVPPAGWTVARNVCFRDGKVVRAPVPKVVKGSSIGPNEFVYMAPVRQPGAPEKVLGVSKGFKLYFYNGSTESNVTPLSGWTEIESDDAATSCVLADVNYVNRPSHTPYKLTPSGTAYAALSNWNSAWRCAALRTYRDTLVAINTTESGVNYPNRVKWSEFAQAGTEPTTWTPDTTNNAGGNDLVDMDRQLLDGAPLGDAFILYSERECREMRLIGGTEVMAFRSMPFQVGIVNQNCVEAVNGQHVCFGPDDIKAHNGYEVQSICDGRTRKRIFDNMERAKRKRFYLVKVTNRSEVWFCYCTSHPETRWKSTVYPNEAAVWNYLNNTWSFIDLPNVGFGCIADFVQGSATYDGSAGTSFDSEEGSWDAAAGVDDVFMYCGVNQDTGAGVPTKNLVLMDPLRFSARSPLTTLSFATPPGVVEHGGLDLDDLGPPLTSYKVIRALYPQVSTSGPNGAFYVRVGASMTTAAGTVNAPWLVYNPYTDYRVDTLVGGRILSWGFRATDQRDFELSAFDLDVVVTSKR